jgi:GTPase
MLIDSITLKIKAGDGGNGAVSFRRNGQTEKGGPDGGNGGRGGNIYFQGSSNINDLSQFRYKKIIKAEDGIPGGKNKLFGKNADDLIIKLPIGTNVHDEYRNRSFEISDDRLILVAKGGKGGLGNTEFKSATNQAPRYAESGQKGVEKIMHLELKFIADIGIIGLPNSGKSSLLTVLTNAKPKIGNYPFTTLEPNLGMHDDILIADIPGLIEGAAEGKGLGFKFLKHIEKTKILIHCISSEETNPFEKYKTVKKELANYNEELLEKEEIILLTKTDLIDKSNLNNFLKKLSKLSKEIIPVSIYDENSLAVLKKLLHSRLSK